VALYGCETWSLTLTEDGILEQGADDNIWVDERRNSKEAREHCILYSSSNRSRLVRLRRVRWVGDVAGMHEEKKNAHRTLTRKQERNRQLGGPRSRWVDNNKTDFKEK
jgi:hypothetical protein